MFVFRIVIIFCLLTTTVLGAEKVISLSPVITKSITQGDCPHELIGCTRYCNPNTPTQRVGGLMRPSLERILMLRPQIIYCSQFTAPQLIEKFNHYHIKQHYYATDTLKGLRTLWSRFGIRDITLQEKVDRQVKIFFAFAPLQTMTVGPNSFLDALLNECGFQNVARHCKSPWPRLSFEILLQENPQVIAVADPSVNHVTRFDHTKLKPYRAHPLWAKLEAVQQGAVYALPADCVYVPTIELKKQFAKLSVDLTH